MSESQMFREPEIYDAVPAPEGRECTLWRSTADEEMEPCDNRANVLFVYEASLNPDNDERRNALSCTECAPVAASNQVQEADDWLAQNDLNGKGS